MKKTIIIVIIIIAFILVALNVFSKTGSKPANKVNLGADVTGITSDDIYATKSDSQAKVVVDVTPKQLGAYEEKNIFEVSLNTHSVEMDYDFSKIIVLKDDLDNIYKALEWTGGQGGHHIRGDIIFPAINSQAKEVELNIVGVGGVDRVFKWILL